MKNFNSGTVLILNASLEPLGVISAKRATLLVLAAKADLVEAGDGEVRSASMSMPMPSVVVLNHYVKIPYVNKVGLSRRAVLQRDGGKCAYCGGKADTVDHVVPRSRSGQNSWLNCVAACGKCNRKKGSKLLSELGWSLNFIPAAPRGLAWKITGSRFFQEAWGKYLEQ